MNRFKRNRLDLNNFNNILKAKIVTQNYSNVKLSLQCQNI